jgi:hypothetical protein
VADARRHNIVILHKNLSQNIYQDNSDSSVELTKILLLKKTRVGFDDITVVLMTISVFWDIIPGEHVTSILRAEE